MCKPFSQQEQDFLVIHDDDDADSLIKELKPSYLSFHFWREFR